MNRAIRLGLVGVPLAGLGIALMVSDYHLSIAEANIRCLERELSHRTFSHFACRSLVEKELAKQRLYAGRRYHLTPPPELDIARFSDPAMGRVGSLA